MKRIAFVLLMIALTLTITGPVLGTSWGLNSFSDSVSWSRFIAIGKVINIDKTAKPMKDAIGKSLGTADITVRVLEQLKGNLPDEIRVVGVDLGDPTTMGSPYKPLPENLVGHKILLFLNATEREGPYKAYMRFLIEKETVRHITFADVQAERYPIADIRAMVAQLSLIQAACPRAKRNVKSEDAALAACRTALYSQYDPVVWYGARRLLSRDIPKDFLTDLMVPLQRQKLEYPVRYLLVQCMGKTKNMEAVPILIDLLRKDPKDTYVVDALRALTREEYGSEADKWEAWWGYFQKKESEKK